MHASLVVPAPVVSPAQIGVRSDLHVPDWLGRSWQRCLASGTAWNEPVVFQEVSKPAVDEALDRSAGLIAASGPTMLHLARAVAALRHSVIVTDCRGIVISVAGDIAGNGPALQAAARLGVDLSEQGIGTASIGSVLFDHAAVSVRGDEHYRRDMRVFNCAAAPLFDLQGELIGVLDVSSDVVPDGPRLTRLVSAASRDIQARLFEHQFGNAYVIRINWHPDEVGSADDAMIGLDDDGSIIAANDAARELWPRLHRTVVDCHASDLFVESHGRIRDRLAQAAWRGEPARLALAHGMQVWARSGARFANELDPIEAIPVPRTPPRRAVHPRRPPVNERFGEYVAHRQAPVDAAEPAEPHLSTIADDLIFRTVESHGGNVSHAARTLGIGRSTIYRRLRYRLRRID